MELGSNKPPQPYTDRVEACGFCVFYAINIIMTTSTMLVLLHKFGKVGTNACRSQVLAVELRDWNWAAINHHSRIRKGLKRVGSVCFTL